MFDLSKYFAIANEIFGVVALVGEEKIPIKGLFQARRSKLEEYEGAQYTFRTLIDYEGAEEIRRNTLMEIKGKSFRVIADPFDSLTGEIEVNLCRN